MLTVMLSGPVSVVLSQRISVNLVWNVVTTGTMAGPLRYDQIDHIPAHLLDKLPRKISKSFYSALLKLQFC